MQKKFEKVLMPVASKLGNNVVLMSLRDGFLIITPLIIVTSIFLLIGNFPIPGWSEFWIKLCGPQLALRESYQQLQLHMHMVRIEDWIPFKQGWFHLYHF